MKLEVRGDCKDSKILARATSWKAALTALARAAAKHPEISTFTLWSPHRVCDRECVAEIVIYKRPENFDEDENPPT